MEDTSCRRFFTDADSATYHRQYEALRAIFVDGLRQNDVADRYGYTHGSLRQLVHRFRAAIRSVSIRCCCKARSWPRICANEVLNSTSSLLPRGVIV